MSASISCSARALALLGALRRGEQPSAAEVHALGEECPAEFFRIVIESLADSFDPTQARQYEGLMRAWIPGSAFGEEDRRNRLSHPGSVYVLSRVTLGADIKITSVILDAMKRRFAGARVVLVGNRKSAELFAADRGIEHLEVEYPRSAPVNLRIEFAEKLRAKLEGADRIVVDPDSRMTQLGLVPVCEPENYFHFPSRTAGGESLANLSELTSKWLEETFGIRGEAYISPEPVQLAGRRPWAAVNLGVGDNDAKRIDGEFERQLITSLCGKYGTVWLDRGAGGAEAARVTTAAEGLPVRFWEGSFAGFASVIAQSDFYVGYDSGGQHAAAAAGTSLVSLFAGACSERFRQRWSPTGRGPCKVFTPPVELSELF